MGLFMPSEIGRLVLGYLKDEGCMRTYQEFLNECVHVAEYATYYRRGTEFPCYIGKKTLKQMLNEYAQYILYKEEIKSDSFDALWLKHDVAIQQIKTLCTPANVQVQKVSGPSASHTQASRMRDRQRSTNSKHTSQNAGPSVKTETKARLESLPEPVTGEEDVPMEVSSPRKNAVNQGILDYESDSDALVVETDKGSACNTPVKMTPVKLGSKSQSVRSAASTSAACSVTHTLSPAVFGSCARNVFSNQLDSNERANGNGGEELGQTVINLDAESDQGDDCRYTNHQRKRKMRRSDERRGLKRRQDRNSRRSPKNKKKKTVTITTSDGAGCTDYVEFVNPPDSPCPASPPPPPAITRTSGGDGPQCSNKNEGAQGSSNAAALYTPKKLIDIPGQNTIQVGKSPRRKRPVPQRRSVEAPLPNVAASLPADVGSTQENILSMPLLDDLIKNVKFAETIAKSINRVKKVTDVSHTSQSVELHKDKKETEVARRDLTTPVPNSSSADQEVVDADDAGDVLNTSIHIPDVTVEHSVDNVLQIQENAMTEEAMKGIMELTKTDPAFDALLHMFHIDKNEYVYQEFDKLEEMSTGGDIHRPDGISDADSVEPVASTSTGGETKRTVLKVKVLDPTESADTNLQTAKVLIPSPDGPPIVHRVQIQVAKGSDEKPKKKGRKPRASAKNKSKTVAESTTDSEGDGKEEKSSRRQTRSRSKTVAAKSDLEQTTDPDKENGSVSASTDANDEPVFKVPEVPPVDHTKSSEVPLRTLNTEDLGLVCSAHNDPPPVEEKPQTKQTKRGGSRRKKPKSLSIPNKKKLDDTEIRGSPTSDSSSATSVEMDQDLTLPSIHQEPPQGLIAPTQVLATRSLPVPSCGGSIIDLGVVVPPANLSLVSVENGVLPTDIINALSIYSRSDNITTQSQVVYGQTESTNLGNNQILDMPQLYPGQLQNVSAVPQTLHGFNSNHTQQLGLNTANVSMVSQGLPVASDISGVPNQQNLTDSTSVAPHVYQGAAGNFTAAQSLQTQSQSGAKIAQVELGSSASENYMQFHNYQKSTLTHDLRVNNSDVLNQGDIYATATSNTNVVHQSDNTALVGNHLPNGDVQRDQGSAGTPASSVQIEKEEDKPQEKQPAASGSLEPTDLQCSEQISQATLPAESDIAAENLERLNSSVASVPFNSPPFYSNPETPSLGAEEVIKANSPKVASPYTCMTSSMSATPDITPQVISATDKITPKISKRPKKEHGSARTNYPYSRYKKRRKFPREYVTSPLARPPVVLSPEVAEVKTPVKDDASSDTNKTPENEPEDGGGTPLATREAQAVDILMTLSQTPVKEDKLFSLSHLPAANPLVMTTPGVNTNNDEPLQTHDDTVVNDEDTNKLSEIDENTNKQSENDENTNKLSDNVENTNKAGDSALRENDEHTNKAGHSEMSENDENKNNAETCDTVVSNTAGVGAGDSAGGLRTPTKRIPSALAVSPSRTSKLNKLLEASANLLINGESADAKAEPLTVKNKNTKPKSSKEEKERKKKKKDGLDRMNVEQFLAKLHAKH